MELTHYLPAFTSTRRPGLQAAACGAFVLADDHSPEPTCPRCQTWIDADEKEADALERLWQLERDAARSGKP